jgi:hypothetical protein
MENIQFEITHGRLVALIAKHIDVPAEQITLLPIAEHTSEVKAIVRTDLQTANKIDRKLKRLEGEPPAQETEGEPSAQK